MNSWNITYNLTVHSGISLIYNNKQYYDLHSTSMNNDAVRNRSVFDSHVSDSELLDHCR